MTDLLKTINPATGETLKTYPRMSDDEMALAIEQCQAAYQDWRQRSLEDRAKVIKAIGDELRKHVDDYAELMTKEMGKLYRDGQEEVKLCAGIATILLSRARKSWPVKNAISCRVAKAL